MTKNDLERLKVELWKRRQEVFERVRALEGDWQTLAEPEIEMGEMAQKAQLTELFESLDLQEQNQIDEINRALNRMAAGTYGICEECGKNIPVERLRALPATRYCVRCSLGQEND